MKHFMNFLQTSYTSFHAVKNAAEYLEARGFVPLGDSLPAAGGKYYVTRGESSLIAFRMGDGAFKIVAAHTDSPCLRLKENAEMRANGYTRLNCEPYGGALRYTFLDRPLLIAGRIVKGTPSGVATELYASDFSVVIPSVAIHQNRDANEKFAVDPQTDLPLLGTGECGLPLEGAVAYDLFAVPATPPVLCGKGEDLLLSPRIDDLTGVYAAIRGIADDGASGMCVAACFDSEEIGSRTLQGAGGDFLRSVLQKIAAVRGEALGDVLPRSVLLSADNAHALHPNHPELGDPTNRTALGAGVVIKQHAGGAYTTNALTAAAVKEIFRKNNIKTAPFFNRSDMRSGSTLGAVSLGQVCVPSADLGIPQLAMHAAVETACTDDIEEYFRAVAAFYKTSVRMEEHGAVIG